MGRILLVHLSDIHVKSKDDPILRRATQIVEAVRGIDYSVAAAVVVVSGDLAYSGKAEEYELVWKFLHEVRAALETSLNEECDSIAKPVSLFAIPGNHDCDHSGEDDLRLLAIDGVLADSTKARSPSIMDACLRVQDSFFNALEENGTDGVGSPSTEFDGRVAYDYTITVGSKVVRLLCLNSAWMSMRKESQGRLVLPADVISTVTDFEGLSIAMLHHPYRWMRTDEARKFQRRIESVADLILTGHEHEATRRTQVMSTGERNEYVEGGVLQDSGEDHSEFNAFVLDLDTTKQKAGTFQWNGARYVPDARDGDFMHNWIDLPVHRNRTHGRYAISSQMEASLNDLGATLTHRDHGLLHLSDVYVFPDLAEVTYAPDRPGRLIPGPKVQALVKDRPGLLLLGDANAGKTCLAKMLFRTLHRDGFVPVLLDGKAKMPSGERLHAYIERQFAEQYDAATLEDYRQLDKKRRVVIVDDFHRLPANEQFRKSFADALDQFANRTVYLANDLITEAGALFDPRYKTDAAQPLETFRILPLGYMRRNELVEKWLRLTEPGTMSDEQFALDREALTNTLNSLMRRNLLPAYPVYVLAILQGTEALTPWDTSVSTYGAYYELLIRNALAQGRTAVQSDIVLNYLAHLAHWLFVHDANRVDAKTYRDIHREFELRFDIQVSLEKMQMDMTERNILAFSGDSTQFKYNYIYYFFVARWLRDHIMENETRNSIRILSENVHIDENANILLFLAHLSKEPVIVEAMLEAARRFYPDVPEITFTDDVSFLSDLGADRRALAYQEHDTDESRNSVLATLDEHDPPGNGLVTDRDELDTVPHAKEGVLDPVVELNAATKTLQILGQLLRNFPGSLEGEVKLQIATECYSLGLRALSKLYLAIRNTEGPILKLAADAIRDEDSRLTENEIDARARFLVGMTAELLGIIMVDLISSAVGSSELEVTYEKLERDVGTPAIKLINASVHLNQGTGFPKGEIERLAREWSNRPFARTILSYLVLMRFHMFPVPNPTKRSVCAILGIKYSPQIDANPLRRLVSESG